MKRIMVFSIAAAMLFSFTSCGETIQIGGGDSTNDTCKSITLSTKSAQFVRDGLAFSFDFIDRINA